MENDSFTIVIIDGNSFRIEDAGVRFFLLLGKKRALLVDSGKDIRSARQIARGLTDLPLTLVNTHSDFDHVASNEAFETFYMHPSDAPAVRDRFPEAKILPVKEGDVFDLGDRTLEVVGMPGHTPGSIALLDERARALISGDTIVRQGTVFMFGPRRDLNRYIESLERLTAYFPRFDAVWPSHGAFPAGKEDALDMLRYAKTIRAGQAAAVPVQMHGRTVLRYDFGTAVFLTDPV